MNPTKSITSPAHESESIWVVKRKILREWFSDHDHRKAGFNKKHERPQTFYHHSYVELLFDGDASGLLSRTVSGNPGVAFTLGNEHEQCLSISYLREALKSRPDLNLVMYATKEAQRGDNFQRSLDDISNEVLRNITVYTVVLEDDVVDVEKLSKRTAHPDSVISACEIARAIYELRQKVGHEDLISRDNAQRNNCNHTYNGQQGGTGNGLETISKPTDLLLINEKSPILETVRLSAQCTEDESEQNPRMIFNLQDSSHRGRLDRLIKRRKHLLIKCLVQPTGGPDIDADIENIYKLLAILSDAFCDDMIDEQGLTFEKLIRQNACRWHWASSTALENELLRRSSTRNARNNVYLVGLTGEGKSTTFNMLLGLKPGELGEGGNVGASVGSSASTTKRIQEGTMPSSHEGCSTPGDESGRRKWTIIDTPGLSDDSGQDDIFLSDMMDSASQNATSNLVLLVKQKASRIDNAERQAIHKYRELFGMKFWEMLRVVCTNVTVLQPSGSMVQEDQVSVDGVVKMVNTMFNEAGLKGDHRQKIFFIGDLPEIEIPGLGKVMPLRTGAPDPRAELERLKSEICRSQPQLTVAAGILRDLLLNAERFWQIPENMTSVTRQARNRLWIGEFEDSQRDHSSTHQGEVSFSVISRGFLGFFNQHFGKQLGKYDKTVYRAVFRGETMLTNQVLRNAADVFTIFFKADEDDPRYLVAHVLEEDHIENRTRTILKHFELIEKGQNLSSDQKRRVSRAVLGTKASREEIRAAVQLCQPDHSSSPDEWI